MTGLPALQPPPEDAPLRTLVWFIVRRWWAGVHILPWQTVHVSAFGIHRYQEHRKTGARRVQTMRGQGYQAIDAAWLAGASGFGEGLRLPPHVNRELAALDATSARLDAQIDDLRDRQRRAPSSPNVNEARVIATRRLTAMVNDAKATPIPALDDLAADIMAARLVGPSGGAASIELLAALRRRLLTDPPTVSASEIFADLGIDPDPPPSDGPYSVNGHGQQSNAMWASVRAAKLAAARAGNPASPLRLVKSDSPPYGSGRMD